MGIKQKIGLVVEGGGMKCAYNAGILDAFLDNHISFDYCIGVSGGAGNVASFVAKQRERNLRFFYGLHTLFKIFWNEKFFKNGKFVWIAIYLWRTDQFYRDRSIRFFYNYGKSNTISSCSDKCFDWAS